jgi:hypothetical protein
MAVLDDLTSLAGESGDLAAVGALFDRVNARLFLRFASASWGKRAVNKVVGGVLTFGATPAPIPLYGGPTGRRALKGRSCGQGSGSGGRDARLNSQIGPAGEGNH